MPLYLTEADVASLLDARGRGRAVEGSFRRLAAGEVENQPRLRLPLEGGALAVMAAADRGLGLAGAKTYSAVAGNAAFVVVLFDAGARRLVAVIEADKLGQLRTGAASGVAAKYLARPGRATARGHRLRLAGRDAGRVHPRRRSVDRDASSRTAAPSRASSEFCERVGAEPAEAHRDAAEVQDIVVTVTTSQRSRAPRRVAAARARSSARSARTTAGRRELDNVVLERAGFVCCDSIEQARLESARPDRAGRARRPRLARGARAPGGRRGRGRGPRSPTTTSSSSSRTGSRRGTSRSALRPSSARASAASAARSSRAGSSARAVDVSSPSAWTTSGRSRRRGDCCGVQPVLHVAVLEDLVERRPRRCSRMTYAATCSSGDDARRGTRTGCAKMPRPLASRRLYTRVRRRSPTTAAVRGASARRASTTRATRSGSSSGSSARPAPSGPSAAS